MTNSINFQMISHTYLFSKAEKKSIILCGYVFLSGNGFTSSLFYIGIPQKRKRQALFLTHLNPFPAAPPTHAPRFAEFDAVRRCCSLDKWNDLQYSKHSIQKLVTVKSGVLFPAILQHFTHTFSAKLKRSP